ncbi:hypothetical protein FYJ87_02855 [Corynebacterium urealyticum]|uniref:Sortase n=2 Tax=Corynebacterium urealyticum TaxID=43771 RepID=A0A5D4G0B1_9CORY|nr:hypothetical protein FYJ87_02855 [Corynebacterium urealyticum]
MDPRRHPSDPRRSPLPAPRSPQSDEGGPQPPTYRRANTPAPEREAGQRSTHSPRSADHGAAQGPHPRPRPRAQQPRGSRPIPEGEQRPRSQGGSQRRHPLPQGEANTLRSRQGQPQRRPRPQESVGGRPTPPSQRRPRPQGEPPRRRPQGEPQRRRPQAPIDGQPNARRPRRPRPEGEQPRYRRDGQPGGSTPRRRTATSSSRDHGYRGPRQGRALGPEMAAVQQRRARRDEERAQHRRPEPQLDSAWRETSSRDGKKKPMWLKLGAATLALVLVFALWPSGGFSPPEDLENNEVVAEQSPPIDPSPVIEMYVPALKMHATFEEGPCRVKDGAINPDTMDKACTYTSEDKPYSLPGTNAKDIVVITGHTGAGVPAVFNDLYDGAKDKHKVSIGDKLYLRTQASGDTWLVYSATDLHDPEKEGLSQSPEIWGEGPMPGRLLTISCIQPANLLAPAVRNAVVGWQFQGTSTTVDKSAGEQATQEAE